MIRLKYAVPVVLSLAVMGCQEAMKPQDSKAKMAEKWNDARSAVQYGLAKQQYEAGDVEGSRTNLDKALGMNPKLEPAHVLSAKLAIEKGDLDKAEKALAEARKLDPKDAQVDYYSGVVYQRWLKPAKALEFYSAALEKSPTDLSFL